MFSKFKETFSASTNKSSDILIFAGIVILCCVAYWVAKQFTKKSSTKYVAKPGDVPPSLATLKFFYVVTPI